MCSLLRFECLSVCRSCWHHRPSKWGNFRSGYFTVSTLTFCVFYVFFGKNIFCSLFIVVSLIFECCLNVVVLFHSIVVLFHSKMPQNWRFTVATQPGTCFCVRYLEHNEYYAHLYDVVIAHVEELVAVLLGNGHLLWNHVSIHIFLTSVAVNA